jgi:inositol-1,3,4-trisphosphate 5/6-kinase / inositol-tetrakisphosphate 1-kinase
VIVINSEMEASGSKESHHMALIYHPVKLIELMIKHQALELFDIFKTNSYILQSYIHHNMVHKVYVLNDEIFLEDRITVQSSTSTNIFLFDSQKLKQQNKETEIVEMKRIEEITKILKKEFHLSLFGFDILIEKETNDYYIVDINYFPGYKNVENFDEKLLKYLKEISNMDVSK